MKKAPAIRCWDLRWKIKRCICVYMCVYIYIYIYIYTHTHINWKIHTHTYTHLYSSVGIHVQCRRSQLDSWVGKMRWRRDSLPTPMFLSFHCGSVGKESTCNVGDLGSILGLGRSPEEGKGSPFQCSGLENSMICTVHGSDMPEGLSLK